MYHGSVVAALVADGWTITHDPLSLKVGERDVHIDLGAERPVIGAEKGTTRIAVEVQSFRGPSEVADLEQALGQYTL
ncbi:MAG: XisH family protein [Gemmataceae bacterium]|nr:XisH family protein [Gemmataceae bacterium]